MSDSWDFIPFYVIFTTTRFLCLAFITLDSGLKYPTFGYIVFHPITDILY